MKNIVKFAVGNPVTICMIVFALLLLGKVSYDQLSVDLLPDLNNPRLFIELKVGERPPEEIEKQFVKNMESMAIRQSDVTQVSSVIKAGTARITVEYIWTKDMDEAFLDLQKAMNPFAQNKEITELKITQHDANLSPVVLVGMSHQNITDMAELRRIAESYIRNELIRLEGVAEVTLSGEEETTLTVQTDPYKLKKQIDFLECYSDYVICSHRYRICLKEEKVMNDEIKALIEHDRNELSGEFCRGCGYCMPCPAGIEINNCARMSLMLRRAPSDAQLSPEMQAKMKKIENCLHCNKCKSKCPYGLDTPTLLQKNYEDYKRVLAGEVSVK